jgi:hypothetical protein
MDAVWVELIKALPWGFVIIVMQYLQLKDRKEERIERSANAADKAIKEKEFEQEKNRLWADTIKGILDRQSETSKQIVDAIREMQRDLQDKYESMGITKDLLDAARREIARHKKGE